jgi:hypothetical protein
VLRGLIVGARSFPGNPYDGHSLAAQLKQTRVILENVGVKPDDILVDLGYRDDDHKNLEVTLHHRGKHRSVTKEQLRQSIGPVFGTPRTITERRSAKLMQAILAGMISPVYLSLILGRWIQIFIEPFVRPPEESNMDSEIAWSPA